MDGRIIAPGSGAPPQEPGAKLKPARCGTAGEPPIQRSVGFAIPRRQQLKVGSGISVARPLRALLDPAVWSACPGRAARPWRPIRCDRPTVASRWFWCGPCAGAQRSRGACQSGSARRRPRRFCDCRGIAAKVGALDLTAQIGIGQSRRHRFAKPVRASTKAVNAGPSLPCWQNALRHRGGKGGRPAY